VVNNQAQVTKTIAFPKQVAEGDYVLTAVVRYKSSIGVSSQKFFIIAGKRDSLFPFSYNDYGLLFVLGVLTFFFIGIVILFVYLIHDRDRLLLELRKYNSEELDKQKMLLLEQERFLSQRRGVNRLNVKKEISRKIRDLKAEHKKRLGEFKELRTKGDIESMKRKLLDWKKKGYNTLPLEYKIKGLSASEMDRIIHGWKKKYKGLGSI